jgi:outer membrane beta-barrel protein
MTLLRMLFAAALMLACSPAFAASPGLEAIREFKNPETTKREMIQNRFFLKENRFEIAPMFGYVPNNPFAKRYVGGVMLGYHFSELVAAEGSFSYSPDNGVNDLKGLAITLVQIAQTGSGNSDFQQPLDKITLSAAFAARFSPIYGKINLVGETVLNFDFYGTAGLGMVSKSNYYAKYDGNAAPYPVALVDSGTNEVKVTPVLGVGGDFFLNQTIALKLDARMALYVDKVPDYQPDEINPGDNDQRLYNNFVASVGLSFFFPKMQPRLYNF